MASMNRGRHIGRRTVIGGMLLGAGALVPLAGAALLATPRQTRGPFYPDRLPLDSDNDLVRIQGADADAKGQVAHVFGRVVDRNGNALKGALVEIWQCDANGVYRHSADRRAAGRDDRFQGYGRTLAAADGAYRFRTIRPVPYPGRTPHIHFAVSASGRPELVTQMYVADEPRNRRDALYNRLTPEARAAVTVALVARDDLETGALGGTFDIVLG